MSANIFTYCLCCPGLQTGWRWWAVLFTSPGTLPVRKGVAAAFAHVTFALIQHDQSLPLE